MAGYCSIEFRGGVCAGMMEKLIIDWLTLYEDTGPPNAMLIEAFHNKILIV